MQPDVDQVLCLDQVWSTLPVSELLPLDQSCKQKGLNFVYRSHQGGRIFYLLLTSVPGDDDSALRLKAGFTASASRDCCLPSWGDDDRGCLDVSIFRSPRDELTAVSPPVINSFGVVV